MVVAYMIGFLYTCAVSVFDPKKRTFDDTAQAVMSLWRICQSLNQMQQRKATENGVTPVQMRCLIYLSHARSGARTVTYLTRELGVTQATISDAVAALDNKGLLYKFSLPQNKRFVCLGLTQEGEELCEKLEDWTQVIETILEGIGAEGQSALNRWLSKVVRQLQQEGWASVSELCNTCGFFRENQGVSPHEDHWCSLLKIGISQEDSIKQCAEHSITSFHGR